MQLTAAAKFDGFHDELREVHRQTAVFVVNVREIVLSGEPPESIVASLKRLLAQQGEG